MRGFPQFLRGGLRRVDPLCAMNEYYRALQAAPVSGLPHFMIEVEFDGLKAREGST